LIWQHKSSMEINTREETSRKKFMAIVIE